MRNSKRMVVAGLAFILLVAFSVSASRGQGGRKDAQTKRVRFLDDGAVDKIFLWDPLVAGQAQVKLALMLIKGEKIAPGLDLGLPGYRRRRSSEKRPAQSGTFLRARLTRGRLTPRSSPSSG